MSCFDFVQSLCFLGTLNDEKGKTLHIFVCHKDVTVSYELEWFIKSKVHLITHFVFIQSNRVLTMVNKNFTCNATATPFVI